MIDFETELKKFQPSMEIEDAEDAIYSRDLTDMMDILQEMLNEKGIDIPFMALDESDFSKIFSV